MPFLRFTRDKRGYETTALVHAFRGRQGRARQTVLYWFRTPPGVKVGRPALDQEAIRWIEEHNPDIEFDWPKILEASPQPSAVSEDNGRRQRRSRFEGVDRRGRADRRGPRRAPSLAARAAGREAEEYAELNAAPGLESRTAPADERAESPDIEPGPQGGTRPTDETAQAPVVALPELTDGVEPSSEPSEGDELFEPLEDEALEQLVHPEAEPLPVAAIPAVESVLGREQLIRFRARYAELQARIIERAGDPARVETLRAQAEPLDPDSWVTRDEAQKGLEIFEPRIRELRAALGLKRRRRSRRGGRRHRREGAAASPAEPVLQTAEADSTSNSLESFAPDESRENHDASDEDDAPDQD